MPLPTYRLASSALQALQVDAELSPLVQRTFSIASSSPNRTGLIAEPNRGDGNVVILQTQYKASTNRMLRVAVNGFMQSLNVVLGVMEELDVDVFELERGK